MRARSHLCPVSWFGLLLAPLLPSELGAGEQPGSLALAFAEPAPSDTQPTPYAPAPSGSEAQATQGESSPVEGWRLELTPFVLAAGMDGTVGSGPVSTDIDVDFEELMGHFDLGAMAHVEIGYDRFGISIDTIYMSLGDRFERGPVQIDWRLEELLLGFAGTYRLGPFDFVERQAGEKEGIWRLRLLADLQAGGRYVYLKSRVNPELLNGESFTEDWLDPVVGARFLFELTRRIAIIVRGDIGGFGAASDLTWSAAGTVRFRIARHVSIEGGYAVIDYDFDDSDFSYNVMSRGPALGFTFDF